MARTTVCLLLLALVCLSSQAHGGVVLRERRFLGFALDAVRDGVEAAKGAALEGFGVGKAFADNALGIGKHSNGEKKIDGADESWNLDQDARKAKQPDSGIEEQQVTGAKDTAKPGFNSGEKHPKAGLKLGKTLAHNVGNEKAGPCNEEVNGGLEAVKDAVKTGLKAGESFAKTASEIEKQKIAALKKTVNSGINAGKDALKAGWQAGQDFVKAGSNAGKAFAKTASDIGKKKIGALKKTVNAGVNAGRSFAKTAGELEKEKIEALKNAVKAGKNAGKDALKAGLQAGKDLVKASLKASKSFAKTAGEIEKKKIGALKKAVNTGKNAAHSLAKTAGEIEKKKVGALKDAVADFKGGKASTKDAVQTDSGLADGSTPLNSGSKQRTTHEGSSGADKEAAARA